MLPTNKSKLRKININRFDFWFVDLFGYFELID